MPAPDINSNYYITTGYGGWNPCIEGNTQYGLQPFAGSVLPNCSGFATGRFNELLNLNACTYLGNANGGDFMYFAGVQGLATGSEPVLGGAMVWKNSGEGHVAIVDQIIDANTIVTVESGWYYTSTPIVRYVTRSRGNGSWHTNPAYNYQGCVYPPGSTGDDDDDDYYYMMFMQRLKA